MKLGYESRHRQRFKPGRTALVLVAVDYAIILAAIVVARIPARAAAIMPHSDIGFHFIAAAMWIVFVGGLLCGVIAAYLASVAITDDAGEKRLGFGVMVAISLPIAVSFILGLMYF